MTLHDRIEEIKDSNDMTRLIDALEKAREYHFAYLKEQYGDDTGEQEQAYDDHVMEALEPQGGSK